MAKVRDIQSRIKSVGSTKKITKAMEMVSASKMRKAIESVLKTRAYSDLSWKILQNLSKVNSGSEILHPLLKKKNEVKTIGIVLITSNRGLCGGFNASLFNKVIEFTKRGISKDKTQDIKYEFIVLGNKGKAIYQRYGYDIVAQFSKLDLAEGIDEVSPIAELAIMDFLSNRYDKVFVAYNDFVSVAKQIPRVKQLLPIDIKDHEEFLGSIKKESSHDANSEKIEYLFEPNPYEILNTMLPRIIKMQLYQALLESNASEHSSRMTAMKQATDAAGELVDELRLFYNKARQSGITSEIAEISAGANALK
ncbi:MAG: ATP synthase F1 subunit gamma [Candidatus Paceibacterota bacterium]